MELPEEDDEALKKLFLAKTLERGGKLTKDEMRDIFFEFMKDRKHLLQDKFINSRTDLAGSILSTHAKNIHSANIVITDTLIDKVEKGHYEGSSELVPDLKTIVPEDDEWQFDLGDKVVVDIQIGEFKSLQKQTLGWSKKLRNVHGQCGYVTGVKNKYDCKIEVYFHEILTSTTVYAGVLRKTNESFRAVPSRWKVGDFVRTKRNKKLVKKFQKRLPDIPEKHIAKQGRVIAVTTAGIFVTFNETSSYAISSPLLQKADNPAPIPKKCVTGHPEGFHVGMKVKVIKDLTTLINNQKDFGGWNWKMSSLAGNVVTISHIRKDGSLIVGMKVGRTWRLNYESVYRENGYHFDVPSDLPFSPGDIVRIKLTGNIQMHLPSAQVLESCIEFLKLPGKVVGIDDDFDVVVRFCNGKKQILNPSLVQKVSNLQAERFGVKEARKMSLRAGCRVKISPGPVRYIKDILSKMKVEKSTCDAILSDSELLGYVDDEHAVIRYKDERMIRINKKFLHPVDDEEYDIQRKLNFNELKSIVEIIESCVAAANVQGDSDEVDGSVDIFSVTTGSPPTVCLRINSTAATAPMVLKNLKDISGWEITSGGENECCIKMDGSMLEVDIVLLTHETEKPAEQISSLDDVVNEGTSRKYRPTPREGIPTAPIKKESARRASTSDRIADFGVRDARVSANDPPKIQGFGDFQFMNCHTTGGSFYVPYVPDTVRTTTENCVSAADAQARRSNVTNINIISQSNIGKVHINKNN